MTSCLVGAVDGTEPGDGCVTGLCGEGVPGGCRRRRGQPLAIACTRSRAPLKWLWSPTVGPDEVYCQIV